LLWQKPVLEHAAAALAVVAIVAIFDKLYLTPSFLTEKWPNFSCRNSRNSLSRQNFSTFGAACALCLLADYGAVSKVFARCRQNWIWLFQAVVSNKDFLFDDNTDDSVVDFVALQHNVTAMRKKATISPFLLGCT